MSRRFIRLFLLVLFGSTTYANDYLTSEYGQVLEGSTAKLGLWWCSSGWKVGIDKALPDVMSGAITIRMARNEVEAAQLVVRPGAGAGGSFLVGATRLRGPGGAVIGRENIEILSVSYVNVTRPTDKTAVKGLWPDPLLPLKGAVALTANKNQPFWIRVKAPRDATVGIYTGKIAVVAGDYRAEVALNVEVYDFTLPDKMTCVTAFGFSPGNVFRYQKLSKTEDKRAVLDKYWANFSAHHISPYDPAPLDRFKVTWPNVKPPVSTKYSNWQGLRLVDNESHSGNGCALIYDDNIKGNTTLYYEPLIEIPKGGFDVRFWYRTAVPGHRFAIALNHYDKDRKWMS
ncbi:MAG: hypothetical protein ACYS8Z_19260, partial [Planctomycetota bacterium]